MPYYLVEGVFFPKGGGRKALEPFARTFWAETREEARRMADEALAGGKWAEEPKVSKGSEEQRMRKLGAAMLPGFGEEGKG